MAVYGAKSENWVQVIVLEWTTPKQLEAIKEMVDKRCQELHSLDDETLDDVSMNSKHPDHELFHGLVNFAADLEIDGYEMS